MIVVVTMSVAAIMVIHTVVASPVHDIATPPRRKVLCGRRAVRIPTARARAICRRSRQPHGPSDCKDWPSQASGCVCAMVAFADTTPAWAEFNAIAWPIRAPGYPVVAPHTVPCNMNCAHRDKATSKGDGFRGAAVCGPANNVTQPRDISWRDDESVAWASLTTATAVKSADFCSHSNHSIGERRLQRPNQRVRVRACCS